MKNDYRVGILGAGLGSRIKSLGSSKPLVKLGEKTLLELLLERFLKVGAANITVALRNELLPTNMRSSLPKLPGVSYIFIDTESSLHTLAELIRAMGTAEGPILFAMADTIMLPDDLAQFLDFCAELRSEECAVLLTTFVDDEKPLWARINDKGLITYFGSEPTDHITSGMYFLPPQAMEIALEIVESGTHKMRHFLAKLAEREMPIKSFVVTKTIDVDHPSDLAKAAAFLRDN